MWLHPKTHESVWTSPRCPPRRQPSTSRTPQTSPNQRSLQRALRRASGLRLRKPYWFFMTNEQDLQNSGPAAEETSGRASKTPYLLRMNLLNSLPTILRLLPVNSRLLVVLLAFPLLALPLLAAGAAFGGAPAWVLAFLLGFWLVLLSSGVATAVVLALRRVEPHDNGLSPPAEGAT